MRQEFLDAVKKGDDAKVKAMIARDRTLVDARSDSGESAILLAMYFNHRGIANLLWDYGAAMNIWEAAAVGAVERVKEISERDPAFVHTHSHDGFTPLQLAAFFGNRETVDLLIARGADVNAISQNQTFARGTPILQSAVAGGNAHVVRALLEHGANPSVVNENEGTPLHVAAFEGNIALVELLLEHGANPNLKTKDGETPYDFAKKKDRQAVLNLLARNKRD